VRQSAVRRTAAFQLERLSRRERAPAREAMTPSMARVRIRVAEPVASHVEATRPFRRATEGTPTDGGPVSIDVTPCIMRDSVAGGTAYVWEARSTSVPSATKALTAVDVPTHLVGWISHPNSWRVRIIR
jgi:hypothetical protein